MTPQERIQQYGTAPHHIACCCQPCMRDFKAALQIVRESSITPSERQRILQAVNEIYEQVRPMTGIEKHWASEPETVIEAVDAIRLRGMGAIWEEK